MIKYTEAIKPTTCLLQVRSIDPDNTETQSAATSTFVDDLATTYVSPIPNGLNDAALLGTLELDHAISQINMKQNLEKAQSIAQCRRKWAHIAYRNVSTSNHGLVTQARYLGPHLHWSGSTSCEASIRVTQAWGS